MSARDIGIGLSAAGAAGGTALLVRLPGVPNIDNLLGLGASLIGASVAVVAGLVVLARQFETADERHWSTMWKLLHRLSAAGKMLGTPEACLNPPRYVESALVAYMATLQVADDLRANGPNIAQVAWQLNSADIRVELERLSNSQGIAAPDMLARSKELEDLADELLNSLAGGL